MTPTIQALLNSFPDKRVVRALNEIFTRALVPSNADTAITAAAGGTQAAAKILKSTVSFHDVTVVATAADSVLLPQAVSGEHHFVKNSAALAMQVFGSGTDTIDSTATATGVSQAPGDAVIYVCLVNGNYIRLGGVQATEAFTTITATGGITSSSPTAGIGYAVGAGGAVIQITSRTTGVTVDKVSGTITTTTTSLAALAAATFTVTNATVAIGDVVQVAIRSGLTTVQTHVDVTATAAGSFNITVDNQSATVAEIGAIIINFAVTKAVSS